MTADNRVVLDYTNRDYKAIRSMLVGLAQGFNPEWTTVGETGDFGTLLLELFAYAEDVSNFYIDRVAAEAFLGTATRRQSVMFMSDMLGYTPTGQQAATVPLTFTWQWDSASTQVAVTTYRIVKYQVSNGVVSFQVTHPDVAVDLGVGQAITLSPSVDDFTGNLSGSYVVDSAVAATDTTPFIVSIIVPEDRRVTDTDGWTSVGPGATMSTGSIVIIPAGTALASTPDALSQSVTFELDADVVLDSALATKVPTPGYIYSADTPDPSTLYSVIGTGTATEGATVDPTSIGVSKGVPNADLVLSDVGIIDGSVKVYTKEGGAAVVWSRINTLAVAGPDQSVYSSYVDDQGSTHILFGDNASGRIPPVSSEIFVGYRVGVGAAANYLDVGTVTNLNFDYATGQGVTVSNTASPSGGSDIESIESMRFSVPRSNAVRRRAVSLDDTKALALQVPGVTKAVAYGDSYTMTFVRIAGSAESRAYITDRTPYFKSGTSTIKIVTEQDHSSDLHPGDAVYLATQYATGSYKIKKVWQAQPTNLITITNKELAILDHADYPQIETTQSSARLTCAEPHGLVPGQPFKVEGLGSPYDGVWIVGSIPDTDRKVLTYHCPAWVQPNPAHDATINDYDTPLASTPVTSGEATLSAYSGLELIAPNVATHLYHPTGDVATDATPNLSFSDPQMRALIAAVESYMEDKEITGADIFAEPVEWTNVKIQASVVVRDLYNRTAVAAAVREAIKGVFDYDNVDFGQRIGLGDVYRAALAVDGVEVVNLSELYISDSSIDTLTGVIVPPTVTVGDIITPARNIPRLSPTLTDDSGWLTASGGLVNT